MKIFYGYKDVWLCVVVALVIAVIGQYALMPVLGFWPAVSFVLMLSAIGARVTLAIVERDSRDARDKGKRRAS